MNIASFNSGQGITKHASIKYSKKMYSPYISRIICKNYLDSKETRLKCLK